MKVVGRTVILCLILAIPCSVGLNLTLGSRASIGLAAGCALAMLSLLSFGLLGQIIVGGSSVPRQTTFLTLILWLLKLPILWFAVAAIVRAGTLETGCFLAGLGLVYSLLVLTAVLEARSDDKGHF